MDEMLVTLQISAEYREKLRRLAQDNKRSMKNEFEFIIDDELIRRFPESVSIETPDAPAA